MIALVVAYMKGCPYCVEVTGENSMARNVQDLVPVYEIERSDPLMKALDISSFPTLLLSTPYATHKYQGARTPKLLRRFVLEGIGQKKMLEKILASMEQISAHRKSVK